MPPKNLSHYPADRPANDNPTPARQRRVTVESLPIVGRIVEGGLVLPPRPR